MKQVGARAGRLDPLISYAVAPGVSSEWLHLYVARELTFGARAADGIEEEEMTVERMRLADALAGCFDGRIQDAKTILALLLVTRP